MKKYKELSITSQAIILYLLCILVSFILSPLFRDLYIKLFKPDLIGGGFFIVDPKIEVAIGGFYVVYLLLLSFFNFLLIKNKKWIIFGIGIIIPALVAMTNGYRYIFWALVLSAAGWGLAQAVLLIKSKKKI